MGGPTRRKKFHRGDARETKANKTKRRARDLDQIYEDLQPQTVKRLKTEQPLDLDLPGGGQHYCVECARYFVDTGALGVHQKSKVHKQRVRELKTVPFSQKEAEAAAGMGSYFAPQPRPETIASPAFSMDIASPSSELSENTKFAKQIEDIKLF
ncbi:zinc finger protein 593-like [Paramacrobiotus metropolitanus]|uniref:zinc finger protein 593-like n=1 Tax=Paramacrobiotus metropolitanus TaxID=2943436 RepID=UPI00244565DB|nr:zinc finger protein 593-like [Paramacrobiotus metropolitanus]